MKVLNGTSIIEIIIAAALISVSIIAALSLANRSQKQNTYARGLAEATKYTSQAAEWVKDQRNILGWATIASMNDGAYCLSTIPAEFTDLVAGECDSSNYISGTIYTRKITLSKTLDTVKVTVQVSWLENIPRQSSIEMELTKW